jgi:RNA polymerase sigma-70 factor (ECF subfamily)
VGCDPARALERRLRAEALWDALSALPDEQGEPLFLHHHEGWPLEKIAAYLSLPVSTVRGRLFRGRETLRRRLRCIDEDDEDGKDAEYK